MPTVLFFLIAYSLASASGFVWKDSVKTISHGTPALLMSNNLHYAYAISAPN